MWFKREIRRLTTPQNGEWIAAECRYKIIPPRHDEAVAKICKKFNISVQHAEDIIGELDKYQWHVRRIPGMDDKVKKFLADENILAAVKAIREVTAWGLLECKLYMEDIQFGLKPWPVPLTEEGEQ